MKKKIILPVIIGIVAISGVSIYFATLNKSDNSNTIYVNSVATIAGYGSVGTTDRFTGVVESQKAVSINADSNKTIKQCFVHVGDTVDVGTELFVYDSDAINVTIDEAQLEVDKLKAEIDSLSQQIRELEAEKASAPADEQFNYTVQIQSLTNEQTANQYDLNSKQSELDKLKASVNTTSITSTVAGIVKSIGFENTGSDSSASDMMSEYDDADINSGESSDTSISSLAPYISIQPLGNYQIKGTLNEYDFGTLEKDMDVTIRSRVDESVVIPGKITSVNTDSPQSSSSSNSAYNYDAEEEGGDYAEGQSATKYNFFVSYDAQDKLMLGQHVYIEPGICDNELKDGLWLPDSYIVPEGENTGYVWCEKNKKLTKCTVSLGKYDENDMTYEIKSGLSKDDFIAFPDDSISEGDACEEADE